MKPLTCLIFVAFIGMTACATGTSLAPPPGHRGHLAHEARYLKIVRDHVRATRGWPDGSYSVFYMGRDDNGLLFSVINHAAADQMPAYSVGGDGSSIYAVVDPKTGKVLSDGVME